MSIPRDMLTIFKRAFDADENALKVLLSAGIQTEAAKVATASVGSVAKGANTDFVITQDEDENSIPNKIYVPHILIIPSAATIFRVRLYAKDARALVDPLWYQWPFGAQDEDFANDATGYWFINRDPTLRNRIFGNVAVDATGASDASFNIFVVFFEGV